MLQNQQGRLNGISPPIGTLLRGTEPLVVTAVDAAGCTVRLAKMPDYHAANSRKPLEIHSVYEHILLSPQRSPFGPIRRIG